MKFNSLLTSFLFKLSSLRAIILPHFGTTFSLLQSKLENVIKVHVMNFACIFFENKVKHIFNCYNK